MRSVCSLPNQVLKAFQSTVNSTLRGVAGTALGVLLFSSPALAQADDARLIEAVKVMRADSVGLVLRKASLEVAIEEVKLRRERGDTEGSERLAREIMESLQTPVIPATPAGGFTFLPPLRSQTPNPYLDSMQQWFERETRKPEAGVPPVTATSNPLNNINGTWSSRKVGNDMLRYFWLASHPQSPLKDNPEAVKRLLRRCDLYMTAYRVHAKKYGDAISDFFATNPAFAAVRQTVEVYPNLLLPSQKQDWDKAMEAAAVLWLDVYKNGYKMYPVSQGRFCNHHIGIANTMLSIGKYRGDETMQKLAIETVKLQSGNLLPDGAFHYITDYNEVANYHSTVIDLLVDYSLITGDTSVYPLIAGSRNYTALSIADGAIAEYATAPDWKLMWNGLPGHGGEPVIALTGDPYERYITDQFNRQRGVEPDIQAAIFYTPGVESRPVPVDFLVYDRNIQGARSRFGRFCTTLNGRNFDPTPALDGTGDSPGKLTFAAGLITDREASTTGVIDSILMAVYPKIKVRQDGGQEWLDWAYLSRDERTTVITGRRFASLATTYKLQSTIHAQLTNPWNWEASQQWISLPDRMIGLVEVAPIGRQSAYAVNGRVRLGYGRSGPLSPKQLKSEATNAFVYGEMKAVIHATNFTQQATAPSGVLRDEPLKATEIILRDAEPSSDQQLFGPEDARYFAVEVRPSWVTDDVTVERLSGEGWRGLMVRSGSKAYAVWHNTSSNAVDVDPSRIQVAGQPTLVHFPRGDEPRQAPQPLGFSRITLPAGSHVLTVSSSDPEDQESGWKNFPAFLEQYQKP